MDRVLALLLLELVLGAVRTVHRVGHRVAHEAVGAHLEQRRLSAPCARARRRAGVAWCDREHVLPSTTSRGMSYAAGALARRRRSPTTRSKRGAHAVAVVLADEDDRQLPQRGHVERLVERADVHGRLAEEADAHLVAAAVLDREARRPPRAARGRRRCRGRRGSRCSASNRCIEPPLPPAQPSPCRTARPSRRVAVMPRASAWPWSR